jgi:hypothetical protein
VFIENELFIERVFPLLAEQTGVVHFANNLLHQPLAHCPLSEHGWASGALQ